MKLQYLGKDDVMKICGVSRSKAYQIIRSLNKELAANGKIIIAGKVPTLYFKQKVLCEIE